MRPPRVLVDVDVDECADRVSEELVVDLEGEASDDAGLLELGQALVGVGPGHVDACRQLVDRQSAVFTEGGDEPAIHVVHGGVGVRTSRHSGPIGPELDKTRSRTARIANLSRSRR